MAISTGLASNYHDAMDRLRIFLLAQGWTVLRWNVAAAIDQPAELAVRPIGTGSFRPTITFKSRANVPSGLYHWVLTGAEDFNAAFDQLDQLNSSPETFINLSNNPFTYWFYANDRRVICVFKIGTSYSNLYAGLFLPYAFPNEYRRPLYIAGNCDSPELVSFDNQKNSFIADPGSAAAHYMTREENWIRCQNRSNSTQAEPQLISNSSTAFLWPKKTQAGGTAASGGSGSWTYQMNDFFRPNSAGEMPMFQCQIMSPSENAGAGAIVGALDGVYDVPGFNRSAEQLLSFGGNNFRLFTNMFRSSRWHFMAIEEI